MNGRKVIATNRKAKHFYTISHTYEAGIELIGSEVKSLRDGQADLKDSFGRVEEGEIFLYNMHISPYAFAKARGYEPRRKRKLLLHKREINRIAGKVLEKSFVLIPLELYFKRGKAKVCLGLGKGKKLYDHREELRQRAIQKETEQVIRERY